MVQAAETVELKPETLLAYATYIGQAEAAVEQMLSSDQQFLLSDACPERVAHLRNGSAPPGARLPVGPKESLARR
jgi:hypothetical protein